MANLARKENGPSAGSEYGMNVAIVFQGIEELMLLKKPEHRRGFAAGQNEPVDIGQLFRFPHFDGFSANTGKGFCVSRVISLNGKDTDASPSCLSQTSSPARSVTGLRCGP